VISATLDTSVYYKGAAFRWSGDRNHRPRAGQDARGKLRALGNHVSPTETLRVIKEDPDDDRILEAVAVLPPALSS
jgi:hypothetical protein